jgi:hypothetical protein
MEKFKYALINKISVNEYYKRNLPLYMYFENKLVCVSNMAGKMFQF